MKSLWMVRRAFNAWKESLKMRETGVNLVQTTDGHSCHICTPYSIPKPSINTAGNSQFNMKKISIGKSFPPGKTCPVYRRGNVNVGQPAVGESGSWADGRQRYEVEIPSKLAQQYIVL